MPQLTLVVGLGNPGPRYAGNRHNIGHMVVDRLAGDAGLRFTLRKRAMVADGRLGTDPQGRPGPRVILAKPGSYMNVTGPLVLELTRYYKVAPVQTVVVHDDLDLPLGTIRLKQGGGEGGHNGLRSISSALGTKDYIRVRVGISRPPGQMDPADYVLRDFAPAERTELDLIIGDAADAVTTLVNESLAAAQLKFHTAH